jgi:predicted RNase H-like nuclease (RuvC/YqgF family)
LLPSWHRLDKARNEYNTGEHNSRKHLEVAQYEIDALKKQAKHEDKASKTLAKQHPHLPVVKATEQSGNSVVDAIRDLQSAMVEAMRVNTDRRIEHSTTLHQQSLAYLMAGVYESRELLIVSVSVGFR